MVDPPAGILERPREVRAWERKLRALVKKQGYAPGELYCLRDELKSKYMQPYVPEKETDEQSIKNAIRIRTDDAAEPREISQVLERLKPVTQRQGNRYRYYVPKDVQEAAVKLRAEWRS
jgi:hypothetical protein